MTGFLNPVEVLKQLKLRKDMVAADFGSGSGGWALPLARELEEGKVYAIDILEEPLSALKSKAAQLKLLNIETRRVNVEKGTPLTSNSMDLVLMTNLLFECENKKLVLEEGKRVLKPGGKILVVDWKTDAPMGLQEGRVSVGEVKRIAEELNFGVEKEFEAGLYHHGLIFAKK